MSSKKAMKNYAPSKSIKVVKNDILDTYIYHLKWPFFTFEKDGILKSSPFTLCGLSWALYFSLNNTEFGQFLAVHLVNLNEQEIKVDYKFTLKNYHNPIHDYTWSDPEGSILFSKASEGNNDWGNDEFLTLDEIDTTNGFIHENKLTIQLELLVYNCQNINSHDNLSESIENISTTKDLIKLANEDLSEVISKLPVRRNIKAQKTQEDKIIHVRTTY